MGGRRHDRQFRLLDGLSSPAAKTAAIAWLEAKRRGQGAGPVSPARLAVLAPALLGRAVSDPASGGWLGRAAARRCAAAVAAGARRLQADADRRAAAGAGAGLGATRPIRPPALRPCAKPTPCRNGRAPAGTICASSIRTTTRRSSIPRRSAIGCRSISMSAAPSMRCCICSMRASGTRCSTTSASSRRRSRSRSCSIKE